MSHRNVAVSVVIPVYNKSAFLPRALESVLAQTFQNFEILLVDDGSTDAGLDAVGHIRDSRVRLIWQSNQGVSSARNTGVKLARSPLIAFLDADDSWEPGFLAAMIELRRRFPGAGLIAGNYRIVDPRQGSQPARIAGLPRFRRRFQSRDYFRLGTGGELPMSASSVCVPRAVLEEVGGFPVGEKMGEDQHVWWRICVKYPFAFDKRCLATYHRDAADRACPANVPGAELPFSRRLREELPSLRLSLRQRWHARRYMGAHLLHLARENARAGKPAVARRLMDDRRARLLPMKWLLRRFQVVTAT